MSGGLGPTSAEDLQIPVWEIDPILARVSAILNSCSGGLIRTDMAPLRRAQFRQLRYAYHKACGMADEARELRLRAEERQASFEFLRAELEALLDALDCQTTSGGVDGD